MSFSSVPPVHPDCRICVTIPARDEATSIESALAAFAVQRGLDGSSLPRGFFEIVVFANGCRDATAQRARFAARTHRNVPIHVIETGAPLHETNVGVARRTVMDFAAARMGGGTGRGIVASVDADTVVDATWVAWLEREARDVDAVAGYVTIGDDEQAAMLAPVRLLYVRELAFRRCVADAETAIDPLPYDPGPRHASFVGASFGVTAAAYFAAGGIQPLPRLEDLAFSESLQKIDARIRHSLHMRATTSARVRPRVIGGFGTFVADLVDRGMRRDTFYVEPASMWLDRFTARAALRRLWDGTGGAADEEIVTSAFGSPSEWRSRIEPDLPFGTVHARVIECGASIRPAYDPVPVEVAIAELRSAVASRNAAAPTRRRAASGAG